MTTLLKTDAYEVGLKLVERLHVQGMLSNCNSIRVYYYSNAKIRVLFLDHINTFFLDMFKNDPKGKLYLSSYSHK